MRASKITRSQKRLTLAKYVFVKVTCVSYYSYLWRVVITCGRLFMHVCVLHLAKAKQHQKAVNDRAGTRCWEDSHWAPSLPHRYGSPRTVKIHSCFNGFGQIFFHAVKCRISPSNLDCVLLYVISSLRHHLWWRWGSPGFGRTTRKLHHAGWRARVHPLPLGESTHVSL